MKRYRYRLATLAVGIALGAATNIFGLPWWVYLVALAIFLGGLASFSIESAPDRSGYDKRGDDSRVSDGGGGGAC